MGRSELKLWGNLEYLKQEVKLWMRMLDISPEGVRLLERNTNELAFVHSPGGAKPLETPPEEREEAKPTTEHKVG